MMKHTAKAVSFLPVNVTFAPSLANKAAVALPIPFEEPVIFWIKP